MRLRKKRNVWEQRELEERKLRFAVIRHLQHYGPTLTRTVIDEAQNDWRLHG